MLGAVSFLLGRGLCFIYTCSKVHNMADNKSITPARALHIV